MGGRRKVACKRDVSASERMKSGDAYLLVELSDIVVGLVLRLNEGRVLLEVLCVRHLCAGLRKVGFLRAIWGLRRE